MASKNHTQQYQLCQWVENDPVLREDFNADNLKTEAAILAVKAYAVQQKPVIGMYYGTGYSALQEIVLGFRPSCLLILPSTRSTTKYVAGAQLDFGMNLAGGDTDYLSFTPNGFYVRANLNFASSETYEVANGKCPYRYIALR